jgi:fused signal recognition particle receptor
MHRSLQKKVPTAPHEVLLVLDSTTGTNALTQAREFHQTLGVTGLIVTKLDGTAKGGIVVAIARELKIPVKFIGLGEQVDDLQPFDPKQFAEAMFAESPETRGL